MPVEREGFTLTVPMTWWEFDLHPATRDDSVRRLLARRVKENPALAEHRDVLGRFLKKAARDAYESGAVYIGCMAQNFDTLPLTASVTVSLVGARTADGTALPADPASIVAGLRPKEAAREGDTWRKVTTVEIPETGLAARTYGIEDVAVPGDSRTVRAVLMQTFIPLPGHTDKVALVAASSSVVDLAEPFFDVFDAVTSTFRYREPGAAGAASTPVG
ncbi:hypothetical protein VSR01_23370 [Actinacidiphila sp. DG2A-62]|jgi:hypothetical protein|uniref:hypothetical protein n=1 Tax=Actinacidiphila sp. DG2A-62 TaxID=3108821 RepID=UPI002DB7CF17|nr:hypothetical protein [Actinacidiphila sp. DG2A-62]MEC3996295.1 hypothetical protein [Actinacidiphila sp. DG2A-62]